jgi:hypothetical protein
LFAAIPCFAGWIANGGKRVDVGIPILGSVLLDALLMLLIYFFARFPISLITIDLQ